MEHLIYFLRGAYTFPPFITVANTIWMFPKIVVPQNGWFILEVPIKMDDLGVPLFSETPIWSIIARRLWRIEGPHFSCREADDTFEMQIFPVAWRDVSPEVTDVTGGPCWGVCWIALLFDLVEICQIVNLYTYIYLILGVFTAFFPGSRFGTSQGSKGSPNRVQGCPMGRKERWKHHRSSTFHLANDHMTHKMLESKRVSITWNWVNIVDFQEKNVFVNFSNCMFCLKGGGFPVKLWGGIYIVSLIKRNSFLHNFFWRCGMGLWSWPW